MCERHVEAWKQKTWRCHSDMGIPAFLGIPIPISLAFWASPVGDAQNADRFDFAKIISDWGKVGIVNFEFTAEYSAGKNP